MVVMNSKRPVEDTVPARKRTRIKLASPSPERTSESDTESIHSCQGYKTELANDTSDTSSSPALQPYHAEYEIADTENPKLKFYLSDDSLEQEDLQDEILKAPSSDSLDNALLGDTSEENSTSPTSNSDVDPGLPRNDYLDFEKCLLCKTNQKNISYPYCSACFTWKKNFFPSRPRKRQKFINKDKAQSGVSDKNICILDLDNNKNKNNHKEINITSNLDHGFNDSGVGSADAGQSEDTVDGPPRPSTSRSTSTLTSTSRSTSTLTSTLTSTSTSTSSPNFRSSEMCNVCFLKPENGLFVHLKIAHKYGCYSCAKEIWYQNGGCPLCRRKVYKVEINLKVGNNTEFLQRRLKKL